MQCISKTYYQMFQLSATGPNLCPQPKLSLISRHSDVASTHQHLTQNFNRPAPVALRDPVIYIIMTRMLGSHRFGARRCLAIKLRDGCACMVC